MINETLLKQKYNLTKTEYEAIRDRVFELEKLEDYNHTVISRCNGTLKSTREWLKKRLSNEEEVYYCLNFFKSHGGHCNCEILFNILFFVIKIQQEVERDD